MSKFGGEIGGIVSSALIGALNDKGLAIVRRAELDKLVSLSKGIAEKASKRPDVTGDRFVSILARHLELSDDAGEAREFLEFAIQKTLNELHVGTGNQQQE